MFKHLNRARFAAALVAAVALVAGCDRVKTELLAPQNPGIVDPSAVGSPTAALALRIGAIGRYKQVTNCTNNECTWAMGGTLADEYKNADFDATRISADQRNTDPLTHNWNYGGVTQSRGFVRDAIAAMKQYAPDSLALIGELYMELAFFEMTLADNYCNGIPLGHTIAGVQTQGIPLTIAQVYDSASNHLDTAIAMSAANSFINNAARVWKARVLIAKDKANAPAAAALVANVPSSFQYDMTYSATSGANGLWGVNNSVARISVADSFDIVGGSKNVIRNAIPFASLRDPRVPLANGDSSSPKVAAEDGVTRPFYVSYLYQNQFDPLVLASGVDARMYEAEAKYVANDIPGMLAILNALRAAPPKIAANVITPMAALPTPPDAQSALSLLFREKALWTFGRGQRLPDLRRLIRQYGRTQDQVFPTGVYFKGGNYGTDVNYPVPSVEQVNPNFSACMDRKA